MDVPGVPSDTEALNSDMTVLEVTTKGLGWAVENNSSLFGQGYTGHDTKEQAVKAARRKRKAIDGPVKIIIRNQDGSVSRTIGGN